MQLGPHHLRQRRGKPRFRFGAIGLLATIDTFAYVASFLSLFFTLDQARIIWLGHNASGVSGITWVFYTISSVVWYIYGRVHRDRVLSITNFIWIALSLIVLIGIYIYH